MNKIIDEVISISKECCPFCGGNKWICWDMTISKSYLCSDVFEDWEVSDFNCSRSGHFLDECLGCGAVAS